MFSEIERERERERERDRERERERERIDIVRKVDNVLVTLKYCLLISFQFQIHQLHCK